MDPRAERPREGLHRRPVPADRGGVRTRVRLGSARVHLSRLKRPGRAAVSGERGVRLALGIARVRGAETAPERAQAARLVHERRIGEARPPALDRARRADPPGWRDHRVAEILRVRPRRVMPRNVQDAVGGTGEPDLIGARAVRRRHPLPGRRPGGSGAAAGEEDSDDDAMDLHGAILRSPVDWRQASLALSRASPRCPRRRPGRPAAAPAQLSARERRRPRPDRRRAAGRSPPARPDMRRRR